MRYLGHGVVWCKPALTLAVITMCQPVGLDAGNAWAQPSVRPDSRERPWFADTTPEQRQRARQVFLEGNKLINVPNFRAAAGRYREAIEIWKNPAFYYNLAIAQMNLLRPVEAYESIQQALRYGEPPLGADKHQRALDIKRTLEKEIAWIDVICNEKGAQVTLDGNDLFVAPKRQKLAVRPGPHQIVATLAGRIPETQQITATGGEVKTIELRLRFESQVVYRRRWSRWIPYAVIAGSTLFFGGAAYLDRSSSQRFARFDKRFAEACEPTGGCREGQFQPILGNAELRQNGARVLYAIGSAIAVSGIALLYLNRERPFEIGGEHADPVAIGPYLSRDGAGMNAAFRF